MTMPTVSVVMTAYQREAFIGDAIASVVAQTFTDFELVVVDDASTDGTVAVAQQWAARDARIRVVCNPRNLGDYPNRNHAASLARGRLLRFQDSDDLLYPHALATLVAGLDAYPTAAFALSGATGWAGGPVPMHLSPRQCYEREFLGFGMFNGGPSSALFRREAWQALGGFPLAGTASDYLYWLRVCQSVSVVLVAGDLQWYRTHPGQELRRTSAARDTSRAYRATWTALHDASCPLAAGDLPQARSNWAWALSRAIRDDLRGGRWRDAWDKAFACGLRPFDWLRYWRRARRSADAGTPRRADGQPPRPVWLPI